MKLQIEISDVLIDRAFEEPHSRLWCRELVWSETLRRGTCVERSPGPTGAPKRHTITAENVENGIRFMLAHGRPEIADVLRGETDGRGRDVFLQYVVFGALVYG